MAKSVDKQRKKNGGVTGKGWVKGKSGNPKGRPKKGSTWSEVANQLLDATELHITLIIKEKGVTKTVPIDCVVEEGYTIRQAVVSALIVESLKGNIQAIRELADRTEGRPAQKLEAEIKELPKGFNVRLLTD